MNSNILEVNNFTLTSSRDIPAAIQKLENLKKENTLIHVVSFMHNTVLVQTLKSELIKIFPNIKIVLL
ncbi:MAG: diguanylate cyclase, partial [Sulfurimonas sp.]|nr:diguanylate cyclase [Sulfurimonas sp.]